MRKNNWRMKNKNIAYRGVILFTTGGKAPYAELSRNFFPSIFFCSRFLGNKTFMSQTLHTFCVISSLTFCSLCWWICKKQKIVLILGGDQSWTKIPCKAPQLWWQEKKGNEHIKLNGKRGFKCLSLWGRSCWADGRADRLVGQTRFHAFWSGFWILDSGSWILLDFGVWDFGSLILDSVLGFGVLIFDSVSCFFWLLLWCSYSYSYSINLNIWQNHTKERRNLCRTWTLQVLSRKPQPVPGNLDILVAGFSCKDRYRMNWALAFISFDGKPYQTIPNLRSLWGFVDDELLPKDVMTWHTENMRKGAEEHDWWLE